MKISVDERPGAALSLMESALRDGLPLAAEYPLVFEEGAQGRFVVAQEAGRVGSTCAILERELVWPGGGMRFGLIGAVSTDEAQRGRGLASAVLERAEAELAARGCAVAILWAEDASFYTNRGYSEVGAEVDYCLSAELASRLPDTSHIRMATTRDFDEMHSLYMQHERRVERSAEESRALFATPGMQVLVQESAARLAAYACYERGMDLKNVLHEWAGAPEGVLACARMWLEGLVPNQDREGLFLMAPSSSGALGALLDSLGAPSACGILGMGKLLAPGLVLDELCRAAEHGLTHEQVGEGRWRLQARAGSTERTSEQLLQLIFPPRAERDEITRLETRLGVRFEGLPATPFFWGLDSI